MPDSKDPSADFSDVEGGSSSTAPPSEGIAPTGPAATEFHIAKGSAWPAGKYKVEIAVDGTPAGTKDFEIK